jgi:hypothetical protein
MASQDPIFEEVLSLVRQFTPGQKLRLIEAIVPDLEEPLQRAEEREATPFTISLVEGCWHEPQRGRDRCSTAREVGDFPRIDIRAPKEWIYGSRQGYEREA